MPIKLNPCRVCSGGQQTVWKDYPGALYSVQCAKCGNNTKDHITQNEIEAYAAWNAANPKEGTLDDAQTV